MFSQATKVTMSNETQELFALISESDKVYLSAQCANADKGEHRPGANFNAK